MSSWKNAHKAHQKPHRERHQPEARKNLGLLEKKKDYKLRADDYNAKKAQLKYLHKKALERNPDEFYYHMINSEVLPDGSRSDKAKVIETTPEQLLLMQTQDHNYVTSRRNQEAKKVARLRSRLHQLDDSMPNKHTFFVENEKEVKKFNLLRKLDVPKELLTRRYNRLKTQDVLKLDFSKADTDTITSVGLERRKAYKELSQRAEREHKLSILQRKMELKKALQDKKRTVKHRIAPESKEAAPVYQWNWERKR